MTPSIKWLSISAALLLTGVGSAGTFDDPGAFDDGQSWFYRVQTTGLCE